MAPSAKDCPYRVVESAIRRGKHKQAEGELLRVQAKEPAATLEELVSRADDRGRTLLTLAVEHKALEVAMMLLDCRASAAAVSAVKGSPLHAAVANKDMGVVDMLLHHHASPWQADGTGRSAWDEAMTANWQEGINRFKGMALFQGQVQVKHSRLAGLASVYKACELIVVPHLALSSPAKPPKRASQEHATQLCLFVCPDPEDPRSAVKLWLGDVLVKKSLPHILLALRPDHPEPRGGLHTQQADGRHVVKLRPVDLSVTAAANLQRLTESIAVGQQQLLGAGGMAAAGAPAASRVAQLAPSTPPRGADAGAAAVTPGGATPGVRSVPASAAQSPRYPAVPGAVAAPAAVTATAAERGAKLYEQRQREQAEQQQRLQRLRSQQQEAEQRAWAQQQQQQQQQAAAAAQLQRQQEQFLQEAAAAPRLRKRWDIPHDATGQSCGGGSGGGGLGHEAAAGPSDSCQQHATLAVWAGGPSCSVTVATKPPPQYAGCGGSGGGGGGDDCCTPSAPPLPPSPPRAVGPLAKGMQQHRRSPQASAGGEDGAGVQAPPALTGWYAWWQQAGGAAATGAAVPDGADGTVQLVATRPADKAGKAQGTCGAGGAGGSGGGKAAVAAAAVGVGGRRREPSDEPGSCCVICQAAPAQVGFLHRDTVHRAACWECARGIVSKGAGAHATGGCCPLCREPIERLVSVY